VGAGGEGGSGSRGRGETAAVNDDLLKESLFELYEEAPCGYLFTSLSGSLLRVNRTFLAWTGYERDELVPDRRFQDLLTIPGQIFYENQYAPLLRMQGFVNEVAFDIVRPGMDPLPVLVNSVRRPDGDAPPVFIASTVFDATSRRAYERELQRARREAERLAAIVDASADAILSAAADLVVQTWNAGAERLFGRAAAEMAGRPLAEVLPLAGDAPAWRRIEQELLEGRAVHLDTVGLHASGDRIDVSASFTPHFGLLGELSGISSIIRDIRERRVTERLEQEFLAMASHELRSPLASIKGHAQLMRRRAQYSEPGVETIAAQADHLDRLVNDLLLASQVAAGRLQLRPADVDLVAEARAAAITHVRPEGAPIRVEAPPEPVPVRADPLRLRQVLTNLLTNAIKYSPAGGEIAIRVGRDGRHGILAVADQGAGIPAEALPHLFDRFYRVRSTERRAQGFGLGLYITRQLVEAQGGTIAVESEVGRGSTFTVTLPLAAGAP
jgi:PAS domain S-box-containing protein